MENIKKIKFKLFICSLSFFIIYFGVAFSMLMIKPKEITNKKLLTNNNLFFTSDLNYMKHSDFFILTVPTPITKKNKPDLTILKQAALTVAKVLKKGAIIILESTVYPGVT